MKVYATLRNIYAKPAKDLAFEVLNELKNLSSRCDNNCLYHTRFVFECDSTDLDIQYDRANNLRDKKMAVRATFSGSKSVHVIFEFDHALEDKCAAYYKEIWSACNQLFFNNEADKACANPARLTRRPGAIRDNGVEQTLLYDLPANVILENSDAWRYIWRVARAHFAKPAVANTATHNSSSNSGKTLNHDGKCIDYEPVKHYLNTRYPKISGNGDSSISLFKAIRCCTKYNDNETMKKVIAKAKNEHWSDKEINHIMANVGHYI